MLDDPRLTQIDDQTEDRANGVITCVCLEQEGLLEVRSVIALASSFLSVGSAMLIIFSTFFGPPGDKEAKNGYLPRNEGTLARLHFDVGSLQQSEDLKDMLAVILEGSMIPETSRSLTI
ncbi:unnamed protein product [Vitrella brassicaformis CCMP3155]|uniref:Uncharacterized protein n=1 Tax=Vitrella brassicaformis (strain CCMP3155) TaxID=1169540 RepID=A0A0G4H181_VITBC|nr:unnamed protein product [Vitrella brassicaformis CCMP3155]|eukprot:CEM37303.1 unnamed protein product [Vitrella brassicaformis CCMP3155]